MGRSPAPSTAASIQDLVKIRALIATTEESIARPPTKALSPGSKEPSETVERYDSSAHDRKQKIQISVLADFV